MSVFWGEHSSQLAYSHFLTVCSHGLSSVYACGDRVKYLSSSLKATNLIGLGPYSYNPILPQSLLKLLPYLQI